jgi:site-specific recombinase XerD
MPRKLLAIDHRMVDRWWTERLYTVSARTRQPLSKVTASRDIAALRSALNKAMEWKFLTENPLTKIRQKPVAARKVVRFLADDEEKRPRQALDERDTFRCLGSG